MNYKITKYIEIDSGHRIPEHDSKCRNLHGHRYKVEAELLADNLIQSGSESGMVKDFGFLKECLINAVQPMDHTLMLYSKDDFAKKILKDCAGMIGEYSDKEYEKELKDIYLKRDQRTISYWGKVCLNDGSRNLDYITKVCEDEFIKPYGAINFLGFIPTAENLARYWFYLLEHFLYLRDFGNDFTLSRLQVWETPTCTATFYRREK